MDILVKFWPSTLAPRARGLPVAHARENKLFLDTFASLYTKRLVNDIANQLATFPSSYKVQTHQRLEGSSTQQKKVHPMKEV